MSANGSSPGSGTGGTASTDGSGVCAATYEAETMTHSTGAAITGGWNIHSNGHVSGNHAFVAGANRVSVVARGEQANGAPRMRVSVGEQNLGEVDVSATSWATYAFTYNAPSAASRSIQVDFLNDYYTASPRADRNLHVDKVSVRCGSAGTGGTAGAGGSAGTAGAGATGGVVGCGGGTASGNDIVVNLGSEVQRIAGFGASTAWGSSMSATDADLLWSTTTGAGLSLHRIRIAPNGTTTETNLARLAVARGATIWATPWSPTPAYKSNNSDVMGKLVNGQAWANTLISFVNNMKSQGIDIYAVSAQNEPDARVDYESCDYTPNELAAFIGTHLGPALAGTGVKVMGPESQNWCGFKPYADAIMANASAAQHTAILATHEYGCADSTRKVPYAAGVQAGKEFWETEIYDTGSTVADTGMGSALRVTQLIHDALTRANMNAWHYWWVYPSVNDNGALWDQATRAPSRRLWVMGNYSRFVRPGFRRVTTSGTVPSGVLLSAYKNPADGTVVVVAANRNQNAVSLPLFVSGAAPCAMTPWVTSASDRLASKSQLSVTGSRFSVTLGGESVTTFVGKP